MRATAIRAAFLALPLLLAACTMPRPGNPYAVTSLERDYRPPGEATAAPPRVALRASVPAAVEAAVEALPAAGFEVQAVDRERGLIAAVYSGEADPWVECGQFVPAGAADGQWLPASRLMTRIEPPGAPPGVVALRQLRLDARLVVEAAPVGDAVELASEVSYLVTRTVDVVAPDGRVMHTDRATLVLTTGKAARLDERLRCRATGRLERVLSALAR